MENEFDGHQSTRELVGNNTLDVSNNTNGKTFVAEIKTSLGNFSVAVAL